MEERHSPNDILTQLALDGYSNTILDSLPVGVEIYDPNGKMLYMSKTDARIFGTDRNAVMAAQVNLFENPNIPEDVKSALKNKIEIHKRIPYDFDLATREGYFTTNNRSSILVECNGRPIFKADGAVDGYVFIIEDVTEIARKEEELHQSQLKTELAIRDSNIMLWEFDVAKKAFYSDNEPLNAYDRSKAISIQLYTETIHPDDRDEMNGIMEKLIEGEDFSFSIDLRILLPDNPEWQYCTISGSPFERGRDGHVTRFVGTRKNNTELQKRQLLQDKILNSIPLSIHIKDINSRYVFCNDESKRMFGTSEEKSTYDVMDAEQVARIEKTDKEVFATGNPYLGLERISLKDGRSYDTIVRKSIFHDAGKDLLLNIRWDQSLQNELERRAKTLSLTLEVMDAYTWFYEPKDKILSFGEGFERPGRDRSRLNTLEKFLEVIHPEDRQQFADTIDEVTAQENAQWNAEVRIDFYGSGNYEWWRARGLLETTLRDDIPYKFMYGMSINIDTMKQTELTLRRNKEELNNLIRQNELVLNNTNSGLAYITSDYIVQWENISVCSKSLTYEAYRKGEPCYKSAHGRTSPCEDCVMQRAMASGQLEQIKFKLDESHTVEIFATPVINNGKTDGIVIRLDDVSERERMIEELRQAKAQAEQSDKLKSAFLANMSHEIRTPLNAIVGFSELLLSDPDSEEKDEYIRIINNNNELLLKLINDILDLSKIEAGSVELKYEEFDLSEYFNGMAASMRQRIKNPNVRLIAVNPHEVCCVHLDKNRIAQILTNYVTNAIKYTPKGYIEMGYESSPDGIRFYVRDSGIGISPEKKSKVFMRFEKLDEFAQGTGLGLSICKAIAESMGGSVGFESDFGQGSYFWAFLPCSPETGESVRGKAPAPAEVPAAASDAEHETPAAVAKPAPANPGKRYRVLIAEDIPSNFLLVSSLLRNRYELIHAENGQEAVEMAREEQPDLILMDMKMPIMNGMAATTEIRKFDLQVPIVALTAHAFDADRQAALAAGCNDYLVKPVSKLQLTDILEKYFSAPVVS